MKSLWKELHLEEVGEVSFDPKNYNFDNLELVRRRITNPVWSEVYGLLKKCRLCVLNVYQEEVLAIPVVGEPDITKQLFLCKAGLVPKISATQKIKQ